MSVLNPIKFNEANKNLTRPENMMEKECGDLWVFNDGKVCISCWEISFWQRIKLLFYGKVWLSILSGKTQPPVKIECANTIFE